MTFHLVESCAPAAGPIVSAGQLRRLPGPLSQRYIARRDEYEGQFRALVQGGIEAGEFAPLDVALTAAGVLGVGATVAQWYRPGGRLAPAEIATHYVRLFLGGLRVRPES
jgi:hypothetical protein